MKEIKSIVMAVFTVLFFCLLLMGCDNNLDVEKTVTLLGEFINPRATVFINPLYILFEIW